jgi:hydrogenase maturation factor
VQELHDGNVLVTTCDPLSYIPELGPKASAWLSVNLIASDLTTSGISPQFGIFDLNLPPGMDDVSFDAYWQSFHRECARLGIAIVGGQTGRSEGCGYPSIGGGVMYAVASRERYLASSMAKHGDELIVTKGAAIETTAVLANVFKKTVRRTIGDQLFEKARGALHQVSTVQDALTAVSVGIHDDGVTAMHDATEGGVTSAIMELASASGLGAEIDLNAIPVSQETYEICKLFRIDPLRSLSEGSLIIACKPFHSPKLQRRLRSAGIKCEVVGSLTSKTRRSYSVSGNHRKPLSYPDRDPYWNAYWKAHEKRWS